MTGNARIPILMFVLALSTLELALSGCFVIGERHKVDERWPIDCAEVRETLGNGHATKDDVLSRFGPPAAVGRVGGTAVLPLSGPAKHGSIELQADALFVPFTDRRPFRNDAAVYYYEHSRMNGYGYYFIPIIGIGYRYRHIATDRLWLLVDETSGTIEDLAERCE